MHGSSRLVGDGSGGEQGNSAEELEHGVHPPDGQDQLARLDKVRAHVDQITKDHVTEGE
jgi:hypothetical protein